MRRGADPGAARWPCRKTWFGKTFGKIAMLTYSLKRLLGLIPTLLIVAVLVFGFVHMLPGDPARLAAGPQADEATVALVRQDLGLDKPLLSQFTHFITHAVRGDFGLSMRSKQPVSAEIGSRFMPTLWLTVVSMVWSVIVGMALGVASAVWRNQWPDRLGMTFAVSGISFPAFAMGMLLMQVFSVQLGWLPTMGADSWKSYILPSITLGAAVAAVMARFTRSAFVEVLHEDFVRTARAKGLNEMRVVFKHALRNAMIPVVTMMGLQFGFLLGGSIVVEVVFNWPGLGRLLVDSVEMRDYPVIQALVLLFSLEFILINLVVDVLYAVINPTIRYK
ncbi:Glutathione transport system permease protein gsiC [Pandoraea pulmonicola]|uniref:Glutathione transport system permease protein GsiC n=2 Tax=Pandoraea pulmonicola TaxID=93221 RepID=A0AAJ5CZD1_PANPU|nr:Glutathione transport system permease protein gsiC [Pandoraea pulmonicola]